MSLFTPMGRWSHNITPRLSSPIVASTDPTQRRGITHIMTWLITIGSGGISRGPSRVGISENFIREHSRICRQIHTLDWCSQFVSWCLTSLFGTNMAISETKGQGWRAIPIQYRKASDILTSTPAAFLFSSHPKGKRIEKLITAALTAQFTHAANVQLIMSSSSL